MSSYIGDQYSQSSSLQQNNKRSCPTMVSEYSILTQIASNLGTYKLNREHNSPKQGEHPKPKEAIAVTRRTRTPSVHREAELLMNFMTTSTSTDDSVTAVHNDIPKVKPPKTPESRPSIISPSFSFEAKRVENGEDCEQFMSITGDTFGTTRLQSARKELSASNCFDLNCPSLSLENGSSVSVNSPLDFSPSFLFSRPINADPVDSCTMDTTKVADEVGLNLIRSFNAAMSWRTKTWIKALSEKLSARYHEERKNAVRNAVYNRSASGVDRSVDTIKEAIKKSSEARVVHSLSKASSTVVVHDVRTTFFVLEQQLNHEEQDTGMNPPKRRRQVSRESVNSIETSEPYDLSHAITLDAKCSVSTSPMKKMTVSFRAPGAIHGTFVRDFDGNARLVSVSITLDTEALALSMEENSRRIVRAASEEWLISPPINFCTIYDTVQSQENKVSCESSQSTPEPEEDLDSQRYYSDRRYESYFSPTAEPESLGPLVTPKMQEPFLNEAEPSTFLPRSLPLQGDTLNFGARAGFLNPRRVSPTEHQCSSFVSPTPSKVTFTEDPKVTARNYPVPPSLVSPHFQNAEQVAEDSDAPSMPALLEVARAAHAKCH
mmetsp:Transcript_27375/g.40539  ORF Transcript_27375/g.40539 Transcript_27375/m.40539 type:complete len:604 (-) Transcript_27375:261-2072(-)